MVTMAPGPQVRSSVEVPLTLRFPASLSIDDEAFFDFCQANPELQIERTSAGEIVIMAPTGGETGSRSATLTLQLSLWARRDSQGIVFDSSAGFRLPNDAIRSPDVSWVRRERLSMLTAEQKRGFLPLCPDFVAELRSPTDSLAGLQAKMAEYMVNGARLGWLIDPEAQSVHVYQAGGERSILHHPTTLAGDPELPGFVLDLSDIWEPGF